ncbi:hypothetical protein SeLEV6574_g04722 [Synchytrium endobioticum]|uniref:Ku70/Ku80 C-terminal arm domain-containing protein n=1 Tax=Synchytrium endobioticum TaxID=286115 RepID=A0A507CYW5_9FUNG|nr:hypothetical protein SeLEV6574_g04707 [Synchytrium endobioticum]TPX44100.1 hypothetical protein SeLEV6574_g04722 [Synchytrium endobioticum]
MEEPHTVPTELVDAAQRVAKALRDGNDRNGLQWDQFENPDLQRHHHLVESIIFDDYDEQPPDDTTRPRFMDIQENAGEHLATLKKLVLEHVSEDDPDARRPKKAAAKPDVTTERMQKLVDDDIVAKLTVPELTAFLKRVGVKFPPKKKDKAVQRVYEYFEKKN